MNRVLVTGAGGFVGRRLCELLREREVHVSALHRRERPGPWQRQLIVDLGQPGVRLDLPEDIDTAFHLAGHAHADDGDGAWPLHHAISVEGTRRVLAALGPGVRNLVYFSSVKAMGEGTPAQGVDESAPCAPTTAYGRARLQAESLVKAAARAGLRTTVLRLPLVYGVGVRGNLARMMRAVRAKRMPPLPAFHGRRSMIHVDDVCESAIRAVAMQKAPTRTYLLSDGQSYGARQLVSMMYAVTGRDALLPAVPAWLLHLAARIGDLLRAGGIARTPFSSRALETLRGFAIYDAGLIEREIGFRPSWTLEQALPAMMEGLAGEQKA